MITEIEHVRVITNDNQGNAPGDFAAVRIKLQLVADYRTYVNDDGWKLVGFSYTAKRVAPAEDYVDLVYRFGGAP